MPAAVGFQSAGAAKATDGCLLWTTALPFAMRILSKSRKLFAAALLSATSVAMPSAGLAAEPVAPDSFQELHDLIKPNDAEQAWTQIPWSASLWDARVKAAAEGKPILLWEMDGHPLGCV